MSDSAAGNFTNIRSATSADESAVTQIARRAYAPYIERLGFEPPPMVDDFSGLIKARHLLVAESEQGIIAGYCALWKEADHIHLSNVAVDPAWQGHGIGRRLVNCAEDAARSSGINWVQLYTNERMTENQQLYPYLGFIEIERRIENGLSRVYYRKRVNS